MTQHNAQNTTGRNTGNNANASSAKQSDRQGKTAEFAQERTYWKDQLAKEPYYESGQQFSDFESAYQVGTEGRGRYADKSFSDAESSLRSEWEEAKGSSKIGWEKAKHAVRAAWNRVEDAMPGDSNKNGH
ncbi:MAG: hypothetical protein V4673_05115 [Pseudomonadota bacterium]|jgi:hypothetical protein